jgi:tetratricopeptide (TPR) repeat protein
MAAYDSLVQSYPDSNRAAYALLQVAGVYHRAGDAATALARYRKLAQDYPDSEFADDAQFFIAGILRAQGRRAEALPLLAEIPTKWPDSQYVVSAGMIAAQIQVELGDADGALGTLDETLARHPEAEQAPTALQEVNRALIAADGKLWQAGRGPGQGGAPHAPAIERNLERLLADYGQSPAAPGAMLDVINYFVQPDWWTSGVGPQGRAKVAALAERMLVLYPDVPEACAARGELAEAIWAKDPQRAEALLDTSLGWAVKNKNHEHYVGGMFMKGAFYASTGQPAKSRAAFEEVLRSEPTDEVAGQARLCIAHTYAREGDLASAVREFDEVSANPKYPEDVRGTAALSKACELWSGGQRAAARSALDDYLTLFPNDLGREGALDVRRIWSLPEPDEGGGQ